MFLKQKSSGDLVEIVEIGELVDPFKNRVTGRFHSGEELQDAELFNKSELLFPSGEELPRCWVDPHYRDG
ncbi:MAG TPA: acetyltransferase [Gammaproteobacteria bacterium]|nr:acetyltransferase [Gammaproteobacteria bacterium]